MKNKTLKISILTIAFLLLIQLTSFAALGKLTLNAKTDKDTYKVGDKVTVTVDWSKEVESAGFVLKYDKDKLAFDSTTLEDNYYNADTVGQILFNWAAFDGKAITNVTFSLVAKAEGSADITVQDAKGFADGELQQATGYEYNNKTITISKVEEDVNGGENKPEEDKPDEDVNKPTIDDTDKEDNKPNNNKPGDSTTSKDDKIPQTGSEITVLLALVTIMVFGTIGFIGYRRLSDI